MDCDFLEEHLDGGGERRELDGMVIDDVYGEILFQREKIAVHPLRLKLENQLDPRIFVRRESCCLFRFTVPEFHALRRNETDGMERLRRDPCETAACLLSEFAIDNHIEIKVFQVASLREIGLYRFVLRKRLELFGEFL